MSNSTQRDAVGSKWHSFEMGSGMGQDDANIKISNVQVNSAGTQITASIQIQAAATAGARQIRLETSYGEVMGMVTNSLFTVTE